MAYREDCHNPAVIACLQAKLMDAKPTENRIGTPLALIRLAPPIVRNQYSKQNTHRNARTVVLTRVTKTHAPLKIPTLLNCQPSCG